MRTINVEGLPDPIVRSLEVVVQTLREEIRGTEKPRKDAEKRRDLPLWEGKIISPLTREEIYRDVG